MEPKLNLVLINEYIKNTRLPKDVYSDLVIQKVTATDKQPVADFPHFSPLILALVAASHILRDTEVTLSIRNGSVIVSYYGPHDVASTIVINNQVITLECHGGEKYAVESDRSKYTHIVLPTLLEKVAESNWDTATRALWTHYLVCAQNLLDPLNPLHLMDVIDICRERRCTQVHELNMLELELTKTNEAYDPKDSKVAQLEEKQLADEAELKRQQSSQLGEELETAEAVVAITSDYASHSTHQLQSAGDEVEDPLPKKIFKELREEVVLYMKRFKPVRIQYVSSEDEQEFELVYHDGDRNVVIAMGFGCHWDTIGEGNGFWISRKDGSDFNVHSLNYNDYDSLREGLLTTVQEAEFHGYSPEQNKGLKQIADFLFLTLNK